MRLAVGTSGTSSHGQDLHPTGNCPFERRFIFLFLYAPWRLADFGQQFKKPRSSVPSLGTASSAVHDPTKDVDLVAGMYGFVPNVRKLE